MDSGAALAVVIPTHNRRDYVMNAVESVLAQQVDVELVVVDDGSGDGTTSALQQIADPRLRLLRHDVARERSAARNTGLRATGAEWVLFLDDDDELAAGGLAAIRDAARLAPADCVAILGRLEFFDDGAPAGERVKESWVRRRWIGDLLADCVLDPYVGPNRAFLRRAAVDAVGGWSTRYPPFEDRLLALQIAARGRVMLVPELVGARRHHASQSDLSSGTAVFEQIMSECAATLPNAQGRMLERRARAIDIIFRAHELPRVERLTRARSALQALRADPSLFRTPLARRTVGAMVVRLLAAAGRPGSASQ